MMAAPEALAQALVDAIRAELDALGAEDADAITQQARPRRRR
jgi:hypothetical protein